MNAIGVEFSSEFAHTDRVNAPELIEAPGRHRGGIDAADIGVGHQREVAEVFDRARFGGEVFCGRRIVEIA